MFKNLTDHIASFVSLNEDEQEILVSYLKHKRLKKNGFLLEEGQVCHGNYFILKGCLRLYFIKDNGNKQIIQFAIENWWMTDYTSFEQKIPSGFFIQAIEETEVAYIESNAQYDLFDRVPKIERYFRLILQKYHSASLMRLQYIYDLTPEDRYRHFHGLFPQFVQRIPQYMLASYLGFTPEFLSKIRAKMI